MGLRIRPIKHALTARVGLVAVNQRMRHHAQLPQVLDTRFPMRAGFSDSAVAMSYLSLLCQGITPFDAIENLRRDPAFGLALDLPELPSSPTVRQRIESRGQAWIEPLVEANGRLLARAGVRPTPVSTGHVPLDIDVFVMDNSDAHKEGVGRTYTGVDGIKTNIPLQQRIMGDPGVRQGGRTSTTSKSASPSAATRARASGRRRYRAVRSLARAL